MKAFILTISLITLLSTAITAQTREGCSLLSTWHSVPKAVRAALIREIGPIAKRSEAFESTDALDGNDTPRSRFFGACEQDNRVVVAIERGGIAHTIEITEFVANKETRKWYRSPSSGPFNPAFAVPPVRR